MYLNIKQKLAVETIEGPVLIISGPGTGKTFTLVERVIHMVGDLGIDPSRIMITTFTNKAADELLDRLSLKFQEKNLNKDINDMKLGNFHSIARNIIDEYIDYTHLKRGYINIDNVEQSYIINKYKSEFRKIPNYSKYIKQDYEIKNIIQIIHKIYEDGIIYNSEETNEDYIFFFNVLKTYEKILSYYNILDFSGILYYSYKLILENEDIRKKLQSQIDYIMVDEYQDTNIVQEKILELLLNEKKNICVVGDDDQALYRFRGASVKNILTFPERYEGTTIIKLDQNFRSDDSIISFYREYLNNLIKENPELEKYRYEKLLFSDRLSDMDRVIKISAKDYDDWNEKIYKYIMELLKTGAINNLNEVALLFSSVNNTNVTKLISYFKKNNIGVYIPKTSKLLSQNEVLKLIGAIYAIFKPNIEKNKIYRNPETNRFLENSYENFYKSRLKDDSLHDFIKRMSGYLNSDNFQLSLNDVIYRLLAYNPFLEYMRKEEKAKKISRFMELIEIFSIINNMSIINNKNIDKFINLFFYDYLDFIKDQNISEFEEETIVPDKDSVSVMTIHASKGMEYPVVIMGSLWDKVYSKYKFELGNKLEEFSKKYNNVEDFEPEKYMDILDFYRKMYTGFSRAKDLLILAGVDNQLGQISNEFREIFDSLEEKKASELNIEKNPIKENKIKQKYSYTTDIAPYNKCPIEYYYKRVLKFKDAKTKSLYYGDIVHESIEFINKNIIANKEISEEIIREQVLSISRQKYIFGAVMLNQDIVDEACDEVLDYFNDIKNIGIPLDSELNILISTNDYILNGNVDMIYEKGGKKHIMDFKTGTPPDENGEHQSLQDYINQLNLYAYLYEKTKMEEIETMSLYFTNKNASQKIFTYKFDEEKNKKVLENIDETIRKIENKEFNFDDKCVSEKSLLRFFINKL